MTKLIIANKNKLNWAYIDGVTLLQEGEDMENGIQCR